jgi:hypothetical protein
MVVSVVAEELADRTVVDYDVVVFVRYKGAKV